MQICMHVCAGVNATHVHYVLTYIKICLLCPQYYYVYIAMSVAENMGAGGQLPLHFAREAKLITFYPLLYCS